MHVRRGDKLSVEANKYEVEDYMGAAESWFESRESNGMEVDRRVYLATDDLHVANDIKNRCLHVLLYTDY